MSAASRAGVGWGQVIRRLVHYCFGHPPDYTRSNGVVIGCISCGAAEPATVARKVTTRAIQWDLFNKPDKKDVTDG